MSYFRGIPIVYQIIILFVYFYYNNILQEQGTEVLDALVGEQINREFTILTLILYELYERPFYFNHFLFIYVLQETKILQ